jgi:tetratricopeptide (TPR) repeat protein
MRAIRQAFIATTTAVGLLLPAPAVAQARWEQPYDRGVRAVEQGQWAAAITELERAIGIDSAQQERKLVEGAIRKDYFPYVYLFIAQLKLGQVDRAGVTLKLAMAKPSPLPRQIETVIRPHREEYERLTAAKPAAPPPGTKPPPPPVAVPPPTAPPDTTRTAPKPTLPAPEPSRPPTRPGPDAAEAAFAKDLDSANAMATAKRFSEAIAGYDALRKRSPEEYARRRVASLRDQAVRGRAAQLADEGQSHLRAGRLPEARAAFDQAERLSSGAGAEGLAATRVAESQARARQFAVAARTAAGAGRYDVAAAQFRSALQADPANVEAQTWLDRHDRYEALKTQGLTLQKQGRLDDALTPLQAAREADAARFTAEGLDAMVATIVAARARSADAEIVPVREALTAYLQGDVAGAVARLEPLAAGSDRLDPATRAHVHAYLGVAYATRAFLSADAAEHKSLQSRAVGEFRKAIAARPDYQLPQLISPRIHALLQTARTSK